MSVQRPWQPRTASVEAVEDLVVAYNFAPFADASAVTVAKRLHEWGRPVDVVTQDLSAVRRKDDSLQALVSPFVRHQMSVTGPVHFTSWDSISAFVLSGLSRVGGWRGTRPYARVYSRSMWPQSHFLAAILKLRHPSTEWRAEFSDPLLWRVDGSPRPSRPVPVDFLSRQLLGGLPARFQRALPERVNNFQAAQILPFALADQLVFTNGQQRDLMLNDLANESLMREVADRSVISAHPTLAPSWYEGPEVRTGRAGSTIRIGYFGTFYPNRGLGVMIEAMRTLTPEQRKRIRLHVFSGASSVVAGAAERAGIRHMIHAHPELPYLDFLKTAAHFDYLLVQDSEVGVFPVANPYLPSKLSDYRGAGTKIFAIVAAGSEMAGMAFDQKAWVGDVSSVRTALIAMAQSALTVPMPTTHADGP